MKRIIKITVFWALSAGFQSIYSMQPVTLFENRPAQLSNAITLTKPELSLADHQLWQLVFRACKARPNDQAEGVALKCLGTLIKQGADINAQYEVVFNDENSRAFFGTDKACYTPLVFAMSSKKGSLVKALLDLGAGVHVVSSMGAPIHAAVKCQNYKIIPELVRRGAHINDRDEWGQTPLFSVLYQEDTHAFNALYAYPELDCTVQDNQGQTPLHFAVLRDNPSLDVIKKLMSRGANPHIKDRLGHTALDYALDGVVHAKGGRFPDIVAVLQGKDVQIEKSFLQGTIATDSAKSKPRNTATSKKSSKKKRQDATKSLQKSSSEKLQKDKKPLSQKRETSGVEIETISPTKRIRETMTALVLGQPEQSAQRALFSDDVRNPRESVVSQAHVPVHTVTADQVDDRVKKWFSATYLEQEKNQASSTAHYARSVYYHQLPLDLINYVITHGACQPYASDKYPGDVGTKWVLRGEMKFTNPDDNPWIRGKSHQPGYYHCTKNSNGMVYHVGFDAIRDSSRLLSAFLPQELKGHVREVPGFINGITHSFVE